MSWLLATVAALALSAVSGVVWLRHARRERALRDDGEAHLTRRPSVSRKEAERAIDAWFTHWPEPHAVLDRMATEADAASALEVAAEVAAGELATSAAEGAIATALRRERRQRKRRARRDRKVSDKGARAEAVSAPKTPAQQLAEREVRKARKGTKAARKRYAKARKARKG